MYKRCLIIWKQRITPKKLTFNQTPEYFRYLLNSWPSMDIWVGQDYALQSEDFASQLALTLLVYHTPLMKSLDSSAPFLDMTHNSSSCYTPLPTFAFLFICLLSFTAAFNSQSESDVTAIRIRQISGPSLASPAGETSGCTVSLLQSGAVLHLPLPLKEPSLSSGAPRWQQ